MSTRILQSKLRRSCTPLLFLFLLGAVAGLRGARADGPPNVILIMADDMGYECVAANGGESYKTPSLDRMAAEGIRFTHCHSQPLCTPSRVQIMTGRYNHRNYVRFGVLDPGERTFGHGMRETGYATLIVGKWQLGGDREQPFRAGFDEYCLWHFDVTQGKERGSRYWDPKIFVNGKLLTNTEGKYGPDIFTDHLIDFVTRKKKEGKPFFVYYPMALPHQPFLPTPTNRDATEGMPFANKRDRNQFFFQGMVAYIDTIVGRILASLDALEIRENTLVIFTGDNGSPGGIRSRLGEREIRGGKRLTTDNGTHVPLIASWKGTIEEGRVSRDLIDFTDVLPTLLDAAQFEKKDEIVTDGRSFLPQLRGEKGKPRDWIYCYYHARAKKPRPVVRFVRDHRWKLYDNGKLFDVQADPLEKEPIALAELTEAGLEEAGLEEAGLEEAGLEEAGSADRARSLKAVLDDMLRQEN